MKSSFNKSIYPGPLDWISFGSGNVLLKNLIAEPTKNKCSLSFVNFDVENISFELTVFWKLFPDT